MTNKLTDARIALLRSGLPRVDHCIVAPTGKGESAKKSAATMIEVGWLKEIKAKSGAPVWRADEATGTTYSLKLTAAGLKFIAANDTHGSTTNPTPSAPGADEDTVANKAPPLKAESQAAPTPRLNFREGPKLAAVMALLRRKGGVTIDEISAVMNWLPHYARAFRQSRSRSRAQSGTAIGSSAFGRRIDHSARSKKRTKRQFGLKVTAKSEPTRGA